MSEKACAQCGEVFQVRSGVQRYCSTRCRAKVYRSTRKPTKNWTAQRKYGIRKRLGITIEEYRARVARANGKCEICGQAETQVLHGKVKSLCLDHDHKTGLIRGVLCNSCNAGLGRFLDDPTRLRLAADYLEAHQTEREAA